jgi:hypothetical protein
MENSNYDDGYEGIKKKAKEIYDNIERVWCPALNDHIVFRKAGFRHHIWKNGIFRIKSEQKRRLALIPCVVEIIQSQKDQGLYRNEGDVRFWAFIQRRDKKIIRVVIRQIGEGEKHFFSVFEEKQKSTP